MKNVVLYERIPTKFILYFSQLYLICNKFLKFRNVYMYRCIDKEVSFVVFLPEHGWLDSCARETGSRWGLVELLSALVACATQKEVRAAVLDNEGGTRRRAHRWEKTSA
jgi:hypothetical protein